MDSYERLKSVATDRISKGVYTPDYEQEYNYNKFIIITFLIILVLFFMLA